MLGFLLFFDTLAFAPYVIAFVIALWAFATRKNEIEYVASNNLTYIHLFGAFLVLCTINCFFHGANGIPNMYMQVFMLIVAFALSHKDAKVFIALTCFECLIGVVEYYFGVSSFFESDPEFFEDEELLYFKRVNGLSGNSSTLSEKVLISSLLLYNIRNLLEKKEVIIMFSILLVGYFVTFNRTAIITFLMFAGYIFLQKYKDQIKRQYALGVISIAILISFVIIFWENFGELIILQFSRGDTASLLTGRPLIWSMFGQFISENLFFGNGSVHLLVPYYSGPIHAHNSFIQVLADNGLFLALLYLINVFIKINKRNCLYLFPFIVLSLTQYSLFWGFSVEDVFFFAFLCNPDFVLDENEYDEDYDELYDFEDEEGKELSEVRCSAV